MGAFFILMLTRDAQLWTSLTVVFGIITVIHAVRARRSWAYLRACTPPSAPADDPAGRSAT